MTRSMPVQAPGASSLLKRYREVRATTLAFSSLLDAEDQCLQSMTDASPTKWHLAHTSWFFETFVLLPGAADYRPFHPQYRVLFNSYYNAVGPQYARPQRGLLSRPVLSEVLEYRNHVDARIEELLAAGAGEACCALIALGLEHEQQHQELAVTDIKHALSHNPLRPTIVEPPARSRGTLGAAAFARIPEGIYEIGHAGAGFAFDNEKPRHRVYLREFEIASRPVSTGEYLAFVEAGAYADPSLWLSDAWSWLHAEQVSAPLYWERDADGAWGQYTLGGFRALDPDEPISHLSYYEADAFARWSAMRLPTEAEWEVAFAGQSAADGDFLDLARLHPRPLQATESSAQAYGGVWEWTASAYSAYPGYAPPSGAIGEYNGKFMSNQMVLRGGSCATPRGHVRPSYRNFFYPQARWQFSGLRLCK